jgi:hypothetical protein
LPLAASVSCTKSSPLLPFHLPHQALANHSCP